MTTDKKLSLAAAFAAAALLSTGAFAKTSTQVKNENKAKAYKAKEAAKKASKKK